MTDHDAAARELVRRNVQCSWPRKYGEGCDCSTHVNAQTEITAALREAEARGRAEEREAFAKHLRDAFYTQRDNTAPGVWLFCRYRDQQGNELLQDDRLFPRHADAQKQIDAFVSALTESREMPTPTSTAVYIRARGAGK